jgi:exodeoxyribonuclease-3
MKIITWNVNSVRTRLGRVTALLARHQPDLLCLQEIKGTEEDFPAAEIAALGYRAELFGQKTYNGVALLSREPLAAVERGFAQDPAASQARVIAGELSGLRVVNLYVVNGESPESEKHRLKLDWLDRLAEWLAARHRRGEPLLLVGDFNIAPEDRDVHDPERWRGKIHCTAPERERLQGMLSWGLSDLLRERTPEGGHYTWWDYRMGAFHRGWGLRIDLALGTAPVAARLADVAIDREERKPTSGPGKPSDHAPLVVTLA